MSRKNNFIIFFILTVIFIFGLKNNVYAYDCNSGSCVGGNSHNINATGWAQESIPAAQQLIVGACANSNEDMSSTQGMARCVMQNHRVTDRSEPSNNNPVMDSNGRKKLVRYTVSRMDAWGGNEGSITKWDEIVQLGNVRVQPGMYIQYTAVSNMSWASDYIDEILYSIDTGQFNVTGTAVWANEITDGYYNFSFADVSVTPEDFRINNVRVARDTDGYWKLFYDVTIEILRVAGNNIYGMSGVTKKSTHIINQYGLLATEKVRAYHYYLPMKFTFSWLSNKCKGDTSHSQQYAEANPNVCCDEYPQTCQSNNPCVNGTSTQTSQEYAQANPGVCCYEYPETCCGVDKLNDAVNTPWMSSNTIWNNYYVNYDNGWRKNVCCNKNEFKAKYGDRCDPCTYGTSTQTAEQYAQANPSTCCIQYPSTCNDPCVDGTSTQTSQEYAQANPGVCCRQYPETCCNAESYVPYGSNTSEPWMSSHTIWNDYYVNYDNGWRKNVCCNNSEFKATHPNRCNPCIYGTYSQTSQEYANANIGTCCYEYPETCCNVETLNDGANTPWISSNTIWNDYYVNFQNGWRKNKCCSDPNFSSNPINSGRCVGHISSTPTSKKVCRNHNNSDYFYTTSYIQLDSNGKFINSNVTCDLNSGFCNDTFTYTYTISIAPRHNYTLSEIGYSYFDGDITTDYAAYIQQVNNGSVQLQNPTSSSSLRVPTDFKKNSLASPNFNYTVSNLRTDAQNNYLVDITVTVYDVSTYAENTPTPFMHNNLRTYFVPIKLELCWNGSSNQQGNPTNTGNNCSNVNYAYNNRTECCGDDQFFDDNKLMCCALPAYENEPVCNGYSLSSSLTCGNTPNGTGTKEKSESVNGQISGNGYDELTIKDESLSITANSPTVVSGTGFEYKIEIQDKIKFELNTNGYGTSANPFDSEDSLDNLHNTFKGKLEGLLRENKYLDVISNPTKKQEVKFEAGGSSAQLILGMIDGTFGNSGISYSGSKIYHYIDQSSECKRRWNYNTNSNEYYWTGIEPRYSCDAAKLGEKAKFTKEISGTTAEIKYTYKMQLPKAYIHKMNATNIEYTDHSNDNNYIDGGNKFYTNITDTSGYYNFKVQVVNGGLSKKIKIDSSDAYTCGYRVLNCAIEGVCPPNTNDPTCDPTVTNCGGPIGGTCNPLTDPSCATLPSLGTSNHYFRPISLTDPFPNNRWGTNWNKFVEQNNNINTATYIQKERDNTDKGESIYSGEPMYKITLTSEMINSIKQFNDEYSDYSDFSTMIVHGNDKQLWRESLFLSKLMNNPIANNTQLGTSLNNINVSNNNKLTLNRVIETNRYKKTGAFEKTYGGEVDD